MSDNTPIQPIDLSAAKAATSRIDLSKATPPAAPAIRVGVNPNRATGRIDLSAIPGAQAPLRPVEPSPAGDSEDIYKRRTALLDTSKIPLSATPAAPAAPAGAPRTIRVARPAIRVGGSSSSASTFSPGRSDPAPAPAEPAPKPTIKLKRPGGASVSVPASPSAAPSLSVGSSDFSIQKTDDEVGGIWAVCALLGFLVAGALVAFQIITMNGAAY